MSGWNREYLDNLDDATAVGYRGEPGNAELDLLRWPMTPAERREFGQSVARIAGELRNASDADIETMLAERDAAVGRAGPGDDLRVYTYDLSEPPTRPWAGEV